MAKKNESNGIGARLRIVRKITPKLIREFKEVETIGAVILGRAKAYTTVESPYGESTKFIGEFRLVIDGQQIASSAACFLPKAAEELIQNYMEAALDRAESEDGVAQGVQVEFAFHLWRKPAKARDGGSEYEWVVEPLTRMEQAEDALANLIERSNMALLPEITQ